MHDVDASVNCNVRFGADSAPPNLTYWQTDASVSCIHSPTII
jgi:hypothetical protein